MAEIIARGKDRWLIRFNLGTDQAGKRLREAVVFRGNKTEAKAWANDEEKRRRYLAGLPKSSFEGYLDEYLLSVRTTVTEKTHESYTTLIRLYVRSHPIGQKELIDLRPADFEALYQQLEAAGKSVRTIRYLHAVLRAALRRAVRRKRLPESPLTDVTPPTVRPQRKQVLTPEQAQAFLQAVASHEQSAIFRLAIETGLRPGEYLGLHHDDIDLDRKFLTVQRTLCVRKDGTWYIKDYPKTLHSRRSIPLSDDLVTRLRTYRDQQQQWREDAAENWPHHGLFFSTRNGTAVTPRNLVRLYKRILAKLQLPDLPLYRLRHACATYLFLAGEDLKVVSERLGHASAAFTIDTYQSVLPTQQRQATDRLARLLGGAKVGFDEQAEPE